MQAGRAKALNGWTVDVDVDGGCGGESWDATQRIRICLSCEIELDSVGAPGFGNRPVPDPVHLAADAPCQNHPLSLGHCVFLAHD